MKKHLLAGVFFFICFKSFPIIYWQPYPIHATVTGSTGHQRVECSVYDSLLGSWQYYQTVYYNSNVSVDDSLSEIITYTTYFPPFAQQDSIYGFIIYDIEQHVFKPMEKYYPMVNPDAAYYLYSYEGMVSTYTETCCTSYGLWTEADVYLYNIFNHQWESDAGNISSDGYLGDAYYNIRIGGFV